MNALYATNRAIYIPLLVWASLQLSAPAPTAPNQSQGFVISRDVNLVVLPVMVRNHEGQFVSGLEESNFHVYENGRVQTITLFRSEDAPVTLGLVVDRSGSMAANRDEVIEGAMAFVEASNPQDEEFVVNFAEKISLGLDANAPFTSNVNELKTALSKASASGRTALFDAVAAALQHLDLSQRGKKVLILISDGGDNASRHNFAQVLRMAQGANVVVYAVGLLDEHSADQNPNVLRQLTKETGGLAYFPSVPADIVHVCRQIAGDIRHQYTIGYNPTDGARNTYRKIRVNVSAVNQGRLAVRTRAGYFSSSNAPADSLVQQGVSR